MNKSILGTAVIIVIILLFVFGIFSSDKNNQETPSPTVSSVTSETVSPGHPNTTTPSPSSTPKATPSYISPAKGIASCSIGGTVDFTTKTNAILSKDTKITYKNVDSVARHINWKITPDEAVHVGPNLFSQLTIPNGSEGITVSFDGTPRAKTYTLNASITYGVWIGGNLEIREVSCSGSTKVNIKY